MLRAAYDPVVRADPPVMLAYAERAASLETDPTLQGYIVARITLGAVLSGLDRRAEAVPVLKEAWERSAQIHMPMFIRLQAAGLLAMCLLETGQEDAARRLVRQTAPAVQATVDALGDASAVAVTFLITIDGRLAYQDGETEISPAPACPGGGVGAYRGTSESAGLRPDCAGGRSTRDRGPRGGASCPGRSPGDGRHGSGVPRYGAAAGGR